MFCFTTIKESLDVPPVLIAIIKAYWPSKKIFIKIIPILFIPSKIFNSFVDKSFKVSILTAGKNFVLGHKILLNPHIVSVTKK